jgi:uncharacterized membrane protein
MNDIKMLLIILLIFLVIDIPMITYINGKMYQIQFNRINNGPMNVNLRTYISAGICYLLLVFGIYHFAVKQNSVSNGAILGLVIYGIYNTTNLATINNYGIKESIVDTVWGTILCTLITYLSIKLKSYMN